MLAHGFRVWLAILGLLAGVIGGHAPAISDCCPAGAPVSVAPVSVEATPDRCCSAPGAQAAENRSEPRPQPAENDRGGCDCPRPCCLAPATVAELRAAPQVEWRHARIGMVPLSIPGPRSADYHLDLMRPPRA